MRLRLLIASLLVGLGTLFTLPFLATGNVTASLPTVTVIAPPPPLCTDGTPDTLHFYFFDKGKESKGSFGPSADKGSDDAVKDELVRRLCGDTHTGQDLALLAVINRLYEVTVPNAQVLGDPNFPPDIASSLVYDAIDWNHSRVVTTTVPDDALTLFMRKRPDDEPSAAGVAALDMSVPRILVTPMSEGHRHSRYLELHFNGSDTPVLLRLPCGFQPVFTDEHKAGLVAD
jgi:hypothetical protein